MKTSISLITAGVACLGIAVGIVFGTTAVAVLSLVATGVGLVYAGLTRDAG